MGRSRKRYELQSFAFVRENCRPPGVFLMQALRILSLVLVSLALSVSTALAEPLSTQDKAKQVWQLLDYLAVDYGGSVNDGRITNEAEYAEMQEFAQTVARQLG